MFLQGRKNHLQGQGITGASLFGFRKVSYSPQKYNLIKRNRQSLILKRPTWFRYVSFSLKKTE